MKALEESEPCGGCGMGTPAMQVAWSPAFGKYLCGTCRYHHTEAELRSTDQRAAGISFYPGGSAP